MPWLQNFLTFANDIRSRSPASSNDESQNLRNGRKLKLFSTSTTSGKPKAVAVDEEFRQSMTFACFNTKLCSQCEALKLDERIAETLQSPDELPTWPRFNELFPTLDESCDFCQFYKNLVSLPGFSENFRCFEIEFLKKNQCLVQRTWALRIAKKQKYLSKCDDVEISREEDFPGLRCPEPWPIRPTGINYEELRNKLGVCDGKDSHVRRNVPPPAHPIHAINCNTRQLEILSPGAKYVCLSYVWGPPRPSNGENPGFGWIPNPAERTVEDAITVTSNLHYKYLWVDKYCIDQEDGEMKMNQILQMDYIYTQADLTIVAAAGDHSDYGLPGVSTQPRSLRQGLRIGNYVLMSCWRDTNLAHALKKSKWMERAWTYQEALLSKRRLFFTDYCYLHDCGKCYTEGDESVLFESWRNCPKRVTHGRVKLQSQWMAYHVFPSSTDMCERIEEYSRRQLSYQSDALNAVAGVLQTYESTIIPEYHYFGLPIFRPFLREADPATTSMDAFVQSLRWSLEGLQVRERRLEFPSWSWVGWKRPCYIKSEAPTTPTQAIVEIELSSGARIDWAQFTEMGYLKHDRTSQSRYIWVEAWTFPLQTIDAPPPFEENVQQAESIRNAIVDPNVVQFKASIDLFCNDSAEELERLRVSCGKGRLLAVVLGDISKEVTTRSIIIVEELDGEYQRVGNFDDTGRAMIWDISASFWERNIAGLKRQWIRLS